MNTTPHVNPPQLRPALSGLLGLRSVHALCLGTAAASPGTVGLGPQHRAMWWPALPTRQDPEGHAIVCQATVAQSRGRTEHGAAPAEVCLFC